MVKINLLPPEIQERRKWDRFYPIVFVVAAIAFVAIGLVAAGLFVTINAEQANIQQTKDEIAKLNAQAEQFAVFEQKEQDLEDLQTVATDALAGRINWAQIANEISLVLPDEMWLLTMLGNEDTGMQLSGYTPNSNPASPDESYKSIAKMMVLLNSLPEIYDVWLKNAMAGEYSSGQSKAPAVQFQATSKVVIPSSEATATSAEPAPPGQ